MGSIVDLGRVRSPKLAGELLPPGEVLTGLAAGGGRPQLATVRALALRAPADGIFILSQTAICHIEMESRISPKDRYYC